MDYSGLPYWFKVVDFLQQNWAVVVSAASETKVIFFSDTCGVFDELTFNSEADAIATLRRNGFRQGNPPRK